MTIITKLPFLYCHYIKVKILKQGLQTQIRFKKTPTKSFALPLQVAN